MLISSSENSKIKMLKSLDQKKFRDSLGLFLIEGWHLVLDAVNENLEITEIFVKESEHANSKDKLKGVMSHITPISDQLFNKIAGTQSSQGIIAVVKKPETKALHLNEKFLVLDRIQDPGNMGTIIRTAAASGFNQIITINCVDVWNPKVIRSSSSGIFFCSFHEKAEQQVAELSKKVPLFIASAEGQNVFKLTKPKNSFGLVIGNEANGVSEPLKKSGKIVSIPMDSKIESLNAAISAGILMYILSHN